MIVASRLHYIPQSRPHPGETLAEKLEEMGMAKNEFALRTGKPEKTILAVLNGESSITPDMAVLFESVTRIPVGFWLTHQRNYDEYVAREKYQSAIRDSLDWARRFPLTDMINKGWLPPVKNHEERTIELLTFFGFAHHTAWEEYYCKQCLKVAFSISLTHVKEPHAVSAWLRRGELQAADLHAADYSEKRMKEALPKLKSLMAKQPEGFFQQLQDICLEAGVKVVHTPCIHRAPINGATRWLADTPLIQLSGRNKRSAEFSFTFFHEVGHILLHGKKDIFLEYPDSSDRDVQKETEADDFASKWVG